MNPIDFKKRERLISRLRRILAYEFSGQLSYHSCDIPMRERIEKLIPKILQAVS